MKWQPINTAPKDKEILLRAVVRLSAEHFRNTGLYAYIDIQKGRHCFGQTWAGVLGGKPSHWKEAA